MEHFEYLIIGGGSAGMAAALALVKAGCKSVLITERRSFLGGILKQCIHDGFGLGYFGENLTGPEYSQRFEELIAKSPVRVETDTMVTSIDPDRTASLSGNGIYRRICFDKCILAAGCREKTIGALKVSGTRPAGIFTAGAVQEMVNLGHYDIGSTIVILGSGDVGQIMARRLSILGKKIAAMIEKSDHPGGRTLNHKRCLKAYDIPLILNSELVNVSGKDRVESVTVRSRITGEEREIPCDTLITAIGLIPERELIEPLVSEGKLPEWLYLAGNCDYVHDLVDTVSRESERTAISSLKERT